MTGWTDVRELLPHRYPILLVDRILELVPGESIRALKAVCINEPWYSRIGSAPAPAVLAYPAALLVESWGQAAGVLARGTGEHHVPSPSGQTMLLGGVSDVEFTGSAYPGSVVEHRVRVVRRFPDTVLFTGESLVEGDVLMRVASMIMALRPAGQLTTDQRPGRAGPGKE